MLVLRGRSDCSKRDVALSFIVSIEEFVVAVLVDVLVDVHLDASWLLRGVAGVVGFSEGRLIIASLWLYAVLFGLAVSSVTQSVAVVVVVAAIMVVLLDVALELLHQFLLEHSFLYLELLRTVLGSQLLQLPGHPLLHLGVEALLFELLSGLVVELFLFLLHLGQLRASLKPDFGWSVF